MENFKAFEITTKETLNKLKVVCPRKCPVGVEVSSGRLQCQGLWVQQTWIWLKPSGKRPLLEPPELTQDWGTRLLEGTNRALCAPGPRRKEQ